MARATSDETVAGASSNLEADLQRLREDVAKLAEQLAAMGEHSYGAAKRAAAEGIGQARAQGEAVAEGLRDNAREIEQQVIASVREKPVTALAVAAGIGFLFALLARR